MEVQFLIHYLQLRKRVLSLPWCTCEILLALVGNLFQHFLQTAMAASILKLNSREDRNTIPLRMIDVLQVGIVKREVYHLALQSF